MKNLNMKQKLATISNWFKSLPKLEKPIVVTMLIIIKIVVPTAILIIAVYKYAEYKTKKKINEETAGNDIMIQVKRLRHIRTMKTCQMKS